MITERMQILTEQELRKHLDIDAETLLALEERGLPFVQLPGEKRVYAVPAVCDYLERIQCKIRPNFTHNPGKARKVNDA